MISIFDSISGLGHFVISIFCLIAFRVTYSTWKKSKDEMIKDFMLMFVFVGIFMLIMGAMDYLLVVKQDLVTTKSSIPGFLFGFAHIFMILAISFYERIPFRVWFPERESIGFWLAFGTGLISIVISFIRPIFPTVEAGITHYNVGTLFSAAIGIWALVFIGGLGGVFFLHQAFKARTHFVRIRSIIFGIGFLAWVIGGPMHDFATTTAIYLFADLLLLSSFVIILLGIFTKKFVSLET